MTSVYLFRHGEAEGNTTRVFHGISNSDITELGERQLECLKERMSGIPIDKIYSSPLKRAYKTACAVRGDRDIDIVIDPQIQEISGGEWELMEWNEILNKFPKEAGVWETKLYKAHPPGGESIMQVYNRMVSAINRFVEENEGKTIAVASHGAALLAYNCYLKDLPIQKIREAGLYDNTAVTLVEFDQPDAPRLIYDCDNSHLGELSSLHKQNWSE